MGRPAKIVNNHDGTYQVAGQTLTRPQAVMEAEKNPNYHVTNVNGTQYPKGNPNGKPGDNVNK